MFHIFLHQPKRLTFAGQIASHNTSTRPSLIIQRCQWHPSKLSATQHCLHMNGAIIFAHTKQTCRMNEQSEPTTRENQPTPVENLYVRVVCIFYGFLFCFTNTPNIFHVDDNFICKGQIEALTLKH
uniref:(northern house mosquito) hypothetical protein n=1 Tax=Culex pipiens TaxID=7175 RepID=A0A8D8BFJ2_CULPI